jgi:predicted nucleic-acid-binding protein
MSGGSLDTNVLLRLLLGDIPSQHNSVKRLFTEVSGQFSVADTAVIELVFALQRHYGFTRRQVAEAVTGLMQLSEINCNRTLFEKALSMFLEHPALSFEDTCLATYATLSNAEPLWTFDKKLANQTSSAELVKT